MIVSTVIVAKLASLHELETVHGLESLWDLFEMHAVSQHNENLAVKRANQK